MQSHRHSNGQPTVFGWQGIIDPLQLAAEYQEVINKLLYGPQNGVHLERLAGHRDIFSARINREDRLLFTTVVKGDLRYLTICEVVKSHHYAKAAIFKSGVLENFREKNAPRLSADNITDDHFEKVDAEALKLPVHDRTEKQYKSGSTHFFVNKYIAMDDLQDIVVNNNDYKPTLVQGAAGSGKTCIAAALLCRKVETELADDAAINGTFKPILYVTESKELCRLVERNWELSPLAERYTKGQVKITTYRQLLNEVDACDKLQEVDIAAFLKFIQPYIDKARNNVKTRTDLGVDLLNDPELMYQELRIISGYYQDQTQYEALSNNQSLLSLAARRWLFVIAGLYQHYLAEQQQIDYALYASKVENRFSYIVVDEAQDYSAGQLKTLCQLAAPRKNRPQICVLADDQQSLIDPLSKASYLKEQLGARLGEMTVIKLTAAYRCPKAVVTLANTVLTIGARLSGKTADKMQGSQSIQHPGNVRLLKCLTQQEHQALCSSPPSPELAVITTDARKAAAEESFGTPLVFTPSEIKGLEFKHIVIDGLMDEDKFYQASEQWELSKKDRHDVNKSYAPYFHALYTACTRATETLTIIESDPDAKHKLRHLLAELSSSLPVTASPDNVSNPTASEAVDVRDRIDELIRAGETKKAEALGKLHHIPDDEIKLKINEWVGTKSSTHNAPKETACKKENTDIQAAKIKPFTLKQLEALLSAKSLNVEKAKAIFNHPEAPTYLFKTALSTGECLFSSLFHKTAFITPTLDLLAGSIDRLLPFLTENALCGKNLKTGKPSGHFPLMWMSTDRLTSQWMCSEKYLSIWDKIPKEALVEQVGIKSIPSFNNTFPLFWFAYHDDQLHALKRLNDKWKLSSLLSPRLMQVCAPDVRGEDCSLIQGILSKGKAGYALVNTIITENPAIGRSINLDDLVYRFIETSDTVSVFEEIMSTEEGRALIQRLEATNPALMNISISTLSQHECRKLHLCAKPAIKNIDAKLQYLTKLICEFAKLKAQANKMSGGQQRQFQPKSAAAFLKENLTTLIKKPDMHQYFFNLSIQKTNQCLFFSLMCDPIARSVLFELLADEGTCSRFLENMTPLALFGSSTTDQAKGVVPFIWLATNLELLAKLTTVFKTDSMLGRSTPPQTLIGNIRVSDYKASALYTVYQPGKFDLTPSPNRDVTVFAILLSTPAGIQLMETICNHKYYLSNIITPYFLLTKLMFEAKLQFERSLLQILWEREACKTLREMIFSQYDSQANLKLARAVLLPFISMDAYTKEELLHFKPIMESLFHMVRSPSCLVVMKELLETHPEIDCILNPLIFSDPNILKNDDNIYDTLKPFLELLGIMQKTEEGNQLFQSLKTKALQNADQLADEMTEWHLAQLKK